MKVVFVGLSNKISKEPLDPSTATGKIISRICKQLEAKCYRMNLMQYAPVDEFGKLRYPTKEEMQEGAARLLIWLDTIKPDKVILLGKLVAKAVKVKNSIEVYHPAYAIRKGTTETYINHVVNLIVEVDEK